MREVRIWWYHSIGWSVVLQRHYGEGSHMAVPFSVRYGLFSRFPINAKSRLEVRRLHEREMVWGVALRASSLHSCKSSDVVCSVATVLSAVVRPCCCPNPTK